MDISVVIPTYNRAPLLPMTLDAVLIQSPRPHEVIVVDDGSTDDTPRLLASYAPAVRTLRIPNSGDLVARNAGLRAATGALVAYCDSDDLWRPGYLAAMAALWRAEPSIRHAFADFVIVRENTWECGSKFSAAPPGFWAGFRKIDGEMGLFDAPIFDRVLEFQPFFPSCLVTNRESFLRLGGWDEGTSGLVGSDFATILRLSEHAPFGVVTRPLVGIRKHTGNFSGDTQAMMLGDGRVLEYVLQTRPSLSARAPTILQNIGKRRRAAMDIAFARGDLSAVRAIYSLLPHEQRRPAIRVKRRIAALPAPLNQVLAACLSALGTMRSRFKNLWS